MRSFLHFLVLLLLGNVQAQAMPKETPFLTYERIPFVSEEPSEERYLRAVWLSQFDMQPLYRDGGKQRSEEEFRSLARLLCETLCADGFNTVFLQARPNGDSMYESDYFPLSKYVSGMYGGSIGYDAFGAFVSVAKAYGLSVHGWVNPLRLCTKEEMDSLQKEYPVASAYAKQDGTVKEYDGRLYFDPAHEEAIELIASGAVELLTRYDLDGIHMDDYFYPTQDASFDQAEFDTSGMNDRTEFRVQNINRMVQTLWNAVHSVGENKVFGIAPAGNLDSLLSGYCVDVRLWGRETGYVDYLLPQLYFGFENKYCPFDKMVTRWANVVQNDSVALYIGLDAAKACFGSDGVLDAHAGTDSAKTEWIRNKDILRRSLQCVYEEERAGGYCFFSYAYLYDRFSGEPVDGIAEEYSSFSPLLTKRYTEALPSVPSETMTPSVS